MYMYSRCNVYITDVMCEVRRSVYWCRVRPRGGGPPLQPRGSHPGRRRRRPAAGPPQHAGPAAGSGAGGQHPRGAGWGAHALIPGSGRRGHRGLGTMKGLHYKVKGLCSSCTEITIVLVLKQRARFTQHEN